jgi:RHS repeat-associated protein
LLPARALPSPRTHWRNHRSVRRCASGRSVYNYFRDYDPAVGRYVESDPIGLAGGSYSTYSYAGSNPISNFDPSGLYCTSSGGTTTCSYPGGPTFQIPTPSGFPAYLGPNGLANFFLYHSYDVSKPLGCANPASVMQALINNPTPGASNPATPPPSGTSNNANVFGLFSNPVTSYLTQDINTGAPVVVNVTQAGGPLSPGYVARTVTNGVAHTYGEGLDPAQSPWLTGLGANFAAEQLLWGVQMQQMINNAPSRCGCSN